MATAALPTYQQEYNSLGTEYNPQTKLINSQIAQLAPQQAAQQASLDQAKVNAFSSIDQDSNARGVLFSGVPIDQQAQYVGTKYLPAVADLASTFQNNKNTLLGQINTLNSQRVQEAKQYESTAQASAADAAYKQAELQLKAQANAISASKGGSGGLTAEEQLNAINKAQSGFKYKQGSNGQGLYTDSHGTPISMAEYVEGAGLGSGQVLDLLQNGTSYDKSVYAKVANLSGGTLAKALNKYKVYGTFST